MRKVIHAFDAQGFAALDPKWSGGLPAKFGQAARELICRIAHSSPSALGQPFTTWSLTADWLMFDKARRHPAISVPGTGIAGA